MSNPNNVDQIETHLNSIDKKIQANIDRLDEYVRSTRDFLKSEREAYRSESQKLERIIQELEDKKKYLRSECAELNASVESNRQDIISEMEETSKIEERCSLLEQKNSEAKTRILEMKRRLERINDEAEKQEGLHKIKSKRVSELALQYKKVLGLDIIPVKKNVIKIEFDNVSKNPDYAYFIIDFDETDKICECCPQFDSLENINFIFNSNPDFYEFLIIMRSKFKAYYN